MRASTLPSPGHLRISQQLRVLAAQAISAAETRGQRGGTSPELLAFFTACVAAVNAGAAVTGITAAPATVSKVIGQTQQITVTAAPSGVTVPDLTYVSSDPTKATVSATGLITAVAVGTATITVSGGGFTSTVAVTVTAS